jgi:predicted RNA-binding protein YlxR (DUF448 family)
VGCGRRAPKAELLRIALAGPAGAREAVPDRHARLPGRGAYLCIDSAAAGARPDPSCLQLALRRRALARALRTSVSVSPELVESNAR